MDPSVHPGKSIPQAENLVNYGRNGKHPLFQAHQPMHALEWWILIVNFDPIKEIDPKVGGGCSLRSEDGLHVYTSVVLVRCLYF